MPTSYSNEFQSDSQNARLSSLESKCGFGTSALTLALITRTDVGGINSINHSSLSLSSMVPSSLSCNRVPATSSLHRSCPRQLMRVPVMEAPSSCALRRPSTSFTLMGSEYMNEHCNCPHWPTSGTVDRVAFNIAANPNPADPAPAMPSHTPENRQLAPETPA